jgi:hypothetical protein
MKSFVNGPQLASLDCCGREQVNIHITNATTVELSRADEVHDLIMFSHDDRAKLLKQFESCSAVREVTAGECTDYERMHYDLAATESPRHRFELWLSAAQLGKPQGAFPLDERHGWSWLVWRCFAHINRT